MDKNLGVFVKDAWLCTDGRKLVGEVTIEPGNFYFNGFVYKIQTPYIFGQ